MRIVFIIFLCCIIGCNSPKKKSTPQPNVIATGKNNCSDHIIPQSVKDYVKNNLQGWSIIDTSDYIKSWWSFYERNQIPYFVTIDLNDDQVADFAFILKSQNALRLVILMGSGDTFTHWIADDFKATYKGKDIKNGLIIEPPA